MDNTNVTYVVGAGCALIALIAFLTLVVVPAVTAYRRPLERVAAVFLSLYVLAAFIGGGILLGAVIILVVLLFPSGLTGVAGRTGLLDAIRAYRL